jgi:hypothetical protein
MRPMPALIVKVVAVAPAFGHADTVVRPSPAPSDVRTTARATAATVPAKIAAQLTTDTDDSVPAVMDRSPTVSDETAMINARSRLEE